jgi:catechol 2,3-dioxygenase-like lactoylglutathione lyase family enzyme
MTLISQRSATPMRGIDHLAFVTDDLPATMDFYTRVLQMHRLTFRRSPDAFARNFPVAGRSRLARYFQVDETLGLLLPLTHKLLGTAVVVDRVL